MKRLCFVMLVLVIVLLTSCAVLNHSEAVEISTVSSHEPEIVDIQILATSDVHGKFYPWDYLLDAESTAGSMTQVATAVKERRTENTILLEAGDQIQDNMSDIFLDLSIYPMAASFNAIGYDAWTTGNHEYNYGMDILESYIPQIEAPLLLSNVWDGEGKALGQPYIILERSGVKIGIVGVVTPNILKWDALNLQGCTVTDPAVECRKAIQELEGKVDLLIALVHMGLDDEYDVPHSGAASLAEACPEFDLIIASHGHVAVEGEILNGILAVENKNQAQTMSEIHLFMEKTAEGYQLVDKSSSIVKISDYAPDEALMEELKPYHEMALDHAHTVIGRLEGDNLTPPNKINGVPQAQLEDTALLDFVNKVQLYYTGAKVSATALTSLSSALDEGPIELCDVSLVYKYSNNTLYILSMTGSQLKTYMEWSCRYFQQYQEGDLNLALDPNIPYYNYDVFSGVNYDINVSKPVGERIENLTWPDGTPVREEDEFTIVVNNYRASTFLLSPGVLFEADDMPKLLEYDVHANDIGGIPNLLIAYIQKVAGGVLSAECDHNWRIVANDWDPELHEKAVALINSGYLTRGGDNGKFGMLTRALTKADLE